MDFNVLVRYKVLDTCFRDSTRYYDINDLIEAVNIALDRINDFKLFYSEDFIECGFNLNEYFDDVIGISVPSNKRVETIKRLF